MRISFNSTDLVISEKKSLMYSNLKDQFTHSYKFTLIISGKSLMSETVEGKIAPSALPVSPQKSPKWISRLIFFLLIAYKKIDPKLHATGYVLTFLKKLNRSIMFLFCSEIFMFRNWNKSDSKVWLENTPFFHNVTFLPELPFLQCSIHKKECNILTTIYLHKLKTKKIASPYRKYFLFKKNYTWQSL